MEPLSGILAFLFFGFIAIVLLIIAVKTIRIVPQATVMLVERLGKFDKVASSGLNILIPFLDRPRAVYWTNMRPGLTSIDLREQYIDLPPQPVITRQRDHSRRLGGLLANHRSDKSRLRDERSCRRHRPVDDYRHAGRDGRHGSRPHAFTTRS